MRARGLTVLDLTRPRPAESFAHARARRGDYDVLLVAGGDGMAHMGFNLVAATPTPLGLIPVGSGNDLARHLGLPVRDVTRALDTALASLSRGGQALDAMRLSPLGGPWGQSVYPPGERWAGCVVSAGFDAAVNARANAYTWPRGTGRYIRGVLHELRSFTPYRYRMRIGGSEERFPGTLIAVANAPSFGGGMKIAPGARASSGALEVVIAGAISRRELLRVFPKIYSGAHLRHPAVRTVTATEVEIGPDTGARIPRIFADG